jgi:MarR family transcriptional regulator, organic hydroperoxide resistance regulator
VSLHGALGFDIHLLMARHITSKVHGFPAWLQLVRAYNYIEARISADLRRADLTLARFHVLVELAKHGPMSQQALADRLLVTKGNVVGLIDKLSARGFVERQSSATDRRVNLLRVTPAGRRIVDRTLPRQMQLIASLMQPLNPREAASLRALLTRLRAVDTV